MQSTTSAIQTGTETPSRATFALTLDDLLDLRPEALDRLYRSAAVPAFEEVAGDLKGRLLAVRGLGFPLKGLLRGFAGSSRFPWRGKTFKPLGAERGEGKNRVILDRWQWYRFTTFVGPSRAGAFASLQLDYDHPENPGPIRRIKDEIRELAPGLYLGQAWLNLAGRDRLVLWFGLEKPGRRV